PARKARGVDDDARRNRARAGAHPANGIAFREDPGRSAASTHGDAERLRPLKQHRVELRPPDLEALPRPAGITAERLEPRRAGPRDPDALVAATGHLAQTLRDAELGEQRLDPRMKRLAGPIAGGGFAFAKDDAQAPCRAGNRRRGAGRPATDDDYV